jgi:SAM-dependent methyltransferase
MNPDASLREARRLVDSARWMWRKHGAAYLGRELVDLVASYVTYPFSKSRFEGRTFRCAGRDVAYVRHHYNRAWRNERCVELGLAYDFLRANPARRVLEVGNVLAHYGSVTHDVLDKYERSPGVINQDVVDLAPDEPFDLILAISTLEHVGFDEEPQEPDKPLRAFETMKRALRPGGAMLVTIPLGQNPHIDRLVHNERFDLPVRTYLRRVNKGNDWREVERHEVEGARWGTPFHGTNALFVAMTHGSSGP